MDSFYIQPTEVTNEMFASFIKQSNYKTDAEKFGWSFVLEMFLSEEENLKATEAVQNAMWWVKVENSKWDRPEVIIYDIHLRIYLIRNDRVVILILNQG